MTVKVRFERGKWVLKVDWRRRRRSRVMPSQARALEVAEKVKNALEVYGQDAFRILDENRQVSTMPRLREYAERWMNERRDLSDSTLLSRGQDLRKHINPTFGHLRLDEIDYSKVKTWVIGLADGHKRATVKHVLATLHACLHEAVTEGRIRSNPATGMSRFYQSAKTDDSAGDPFSLEELHLIEEIIHDRFPDHYEFVLTLSRTGMRIGEASSLKWGDIDWHRKQIAIRRTFSGRSRKAGNPKTRAGSRSVDMSPDLYEALSAHKRRCLEKWMKRGKDMPEWVFATSRGTAINYSHFRDRVWARTLKLSGLHYRTPHHLRHTWVSLLLSQGEDPAYVSKQLGHASLAITLGIYAHWVPGSVRVGAAGLDRRGATNTQQGDKRHDSVAGND